MSDCSGEKTVTDYHLVLAKVGERFMVSKQTMHREVQSQGIKGGKG
jgi:hypothetical protein